MVNKNMSMDEVVKDIRRSTAVFEKFGLGCVSCQAALLENIEQGAVVQV